MEEYSKSDGLVRWVVLYVGKVVGYGWFAMVGFA